MFCKLAKKKKRIIAKQNKNPFQESNAAWKGNFKNSNIVKGENT